MKKISSFLGKSGVAFSAVLLATALIFVSFFCFQMQVDSYICTDMRAQVDEIQKGSSLLIRNEMNTLKRLTLAAAQMISQSALSTNDDIIKALQGYAEGSDIFRTLFITLDGDTYTNYSGYLGHTDESTIINELPLNKITEPIFTQPYYDKSSHEVVVGVIVPTTMAEKQGVLVSLYNVKTLSGLLELQFGNYHSDIGIINSNGEVISGKTVEEFNMNIFNSLSKVHFDESSSDEMQTNFTNGSAGFSIYRVGDVSRYCSYAPIGLNNWYIIVMIKETVLRSKLANLEHYGFQLTFELVLIMVCLLVVIMLTRLQEQKRIRKILERAAMLDGLTGIYNRKTTEEAVDRALQMAASLDNASLLVIDIDNFKQLNDCKGHIFGDSVLKECASRLYRAFGDDGIVGRVGGDEFIVFLYDSLTPTQIEKKISNFIRDFSVFCSDDEVKKVSVSAGIAQADQNNNTFLALYQAADNALYRAKRNGKERLSR